jgi:hypothetical protein
MGQFQVLRFEPDGISRLVLFGWHPRLCRQFLDSRNCLFLVPFEESHAFLRCLIARLGTIHGRKGGLVPPKDLIGR